MPNTVAINPHPTSKGGTGTDKNGVRPRRLTYQHGLPIARVTTKLLAMSYADRSMTVGQIKQMLEQEYLALGSNVPPPHSRNLEGMASGILATVSREVRHLQPARQNDSDTSA